MRNLAAELPAEAAELQADLQRAEIALADKNSFVLIGAIYENLLANVFFLDVNLSFGVSGTQSAGFWIQTPPPFPTGLNFFVAHIQRCRSIRATWSV